MSGARLCAVLGDLEFSSGGGGAGDALDPDSFEWPFQYKEVRPVLDWICSTLRPSNVLSTSEISQWCIVLSNSGADNGYVGIAAPSPARILPIDLANFGGEILIQPDAFLCSVNDVTIKSSVDLRARNVFSGSEVFLKQKLVGQGLAFLVGCGSVVQKILDVGEVVVVDVACIVAMTSTIDFQLKQSNPVRRAIFGGETQFTASLTGPGIVFIQSLPFHRLSQRIARAVTPPGMRESPKFFIQIAIFFFLAYVMIVSSLILTDI